MRLALVAVAVLLAGCAGGSDAPSGSLEKSNVSPTLPPTQALANASAVVDAPAWVVGDAWSIDSFAGNEHDAGTLVVTAAEGDSFTIATTSDQTATFDAAFDVSYVGKIRARDLAGAQKDKTVQFFDFPLSDGKSWSTPWDGTQVNLTATFAPKIATPLGPQPGFLVKGEARGKDYVEYDFVPALGWWSKLHFVADGYGFDVKGVSHNWTGAYKTGTSKTLLTLAPAAPVAPTPAGVFIVDKDQSLVLLTFAGHASQYARGFALVDPAGQPYTTKSITNFEAGASANGWFTTEALPPTAGEWRVAAPAVNDPAGGFVLTVQEIAIAAKTL